MQYIKDNIKQKILLTAKNEFLKNGFEKTSIRKIAALSGTSKSNIYNYYKDKDEIFCAVVQPVLDKINEGLKINNLQNKKRTVKTYTVETQKEYIKIIISFVFKNLDEIKLLLFNAAGSSLEGFKIRIISDLSEIIKKWIHQITPDKKISVFFIQCISSFYVNTIEQIIINGISPEKAAEHFNDFIKFVYNGWYSIIKE